MTNPHTTTRKGFTLIELLTVIAIIGILAAILIPTIGSVMEIAHKATSSNNAAQIAKTYSSFSSGSGSQSRNIATPAQAGSGSAATGVANDINDVAFILSKFSNLNDASFWFIKGDEQLSGTRIPRAVITGDISNQTTPSSEFVKAGPKGWAFVTGLSTSAPVTTTPLLWTYGLKTSGEWVILSPWKGKGGHIAFLDGHVEWFDRLSKEEGATNNLIIYQSNPNQGMPTANYLDAINSGGGNRAAKVVNPMGESK